MSLPDASSIVIETNSLNVGYGKKIILRNFTHSIFMGEFILLLGPNGSGKTTLLKTFLGALKPLGGKLKVLNHEPHQNCHQIGYMPQVSLSPQLQHLNARTLLTACIQGHQWGLPHLTNHQKEEIESVLHETASLEFADKPFNTCSGGQQRRIMLAQALLGKPKVLLLDEPLINLDFRQQENFIEILTQLNRTKKVTILISSHDINPLMHVLSRLLYLVNGEAVLGNFSEVLNSEKLTSLYQTPMEVIQYQNRYFVVHKETGYLEQINCDSH